MKKFKLNSTTHKSADIIVDELKKRAKKQNRIYAMAFIFVAFITIGYILNELSVNEYDGYISHKDIPIRAVSNVAIVDYYVKPGDIVNEGDTLYSFLMADWLEDQANPYTDNIADEKKNDSNLRIAKYESEIIEINNTINSLHTAINNIKEEIRSGVKTEDELVNLNLELKDRIERSEHIRRSINAEHQLQTKYTDNIENATSLIAQGLTSRRENLDEYGRALRYAVAYVNSKIINIRASMGMVTFSKEDILTFQPINHPEMTNSHINMIVEAKRYQNIKDGMEVEVYASGQYLCSATVSFLGVRMADAYSNIESLLDRSTDINGKLVIPLKFKDNYTLPENYYIHNYPVEVRHRIWDRFLNNLINPEQ